MQVGTLISQMKQQVSVLDSIDKLIKHCRDNDLTEGVSNEEIDFLIKHSAGMRRACNATIVLAEAVKAVEAAQKKETKPPEKAKASRKKAPPKDEDMDFLD